jgi:hypothetical protein
MGYKTQQEGVVTIFNDKNELIAIIYKDMNSRKNIFYSVTEMGMKELEKLVGSDVVKPIN